MEELIFQYEEVRADISSPTQALREGRDGAHILLKDGQNRWVLSTKRHYIDGLWRMVGGGIEPGEDPLQGAQRELQEELGIEIDEAKLVPLIHAEVIANLDGQTYTYSDFVFYTSVVQPLEVADELDKLGHFTDGELGRVINFFDQLPDRAIEADNRDGTWRDYGKVWDPIHKAAFNRAKELGF